VGATITQLLISYNGEQWRLGATGRVDRLDFQYSTNATSLTTGTWVDADTLDFTAPVTAGTVGALDGNAAANRTAISNTISGLNIPNGATFWIRWNDLNATGSDDGLAVDDFSLTANGGPVTPVISIGDVSAAEGNSGTTAFNFQVTLTAPAPAGGVTFNYATADGTATVANNDYNQITTTGGTIAAGNTSTTVTVFVNGDTTTEPNETFFVNLSNISPNATAGDLQGQGTINNDDVTLTGICTIQGNGATSTYNGQNVSTTGVVTGIKAGSSGGYYIQDDACDADPTTSNGIFVFTGATVPAAAVVGNLVQVTGTIQEFIPSADLFQKPLTEFTSGSSAIVLGTQALPTPVTITAADTQVNDLNNLEKYEGMRVAVPSLTVVGPTQGSITEPGATVTSNGVFFGVVTGVLRPFREAGINVSDPLPPGAPATVTRFDENPERIRVDSDGQPGTTALDVAAGTIITNLVGELDYSFRAYTVLPEPANPPTVGTQPGPTAVPTPLPSELTVASFNMERFFDTVNDPSTSDPVLTTSAYNRRVAKASLIIRTLQHYPDVIGVEEMENLSTLQNVAAQVNSDAVNLDSLPNPQYVAYLIEGSDIGGIDVGFLVKSSRVTVGSVTQIELPGCDHVTPSTCNNYTDPNDGSLDILNDRPPLVLQATIPRTDNTPFAFTVIVNHMRSLSGVDDPTVAGTGTVGARVREKRRKGAEFLANYIQSRQTADPNERLITVGDLNAFRVSDGYVDVIGTLLGTPTPANQVTLASPDLVNPNQIDLVDTLPAAQQYSYNFDGNAQTLDHIIVNPNANSSLNRFAYVRNDSDFPVKNYESTNALRISDHDQPVAYFNLAPAVTPPVCATNVAASSYGATATASSTINANHPASGAIDGNHTSWASGAGWNDGTANAYPDDLTINLGTSQQISEVDVYSLQDNYSSPVEPGDAMTFNYYGLTSFEVQVPDGVGGWMTVPGGNITGNNLVRRRVVFGSPVTTSQIRIKVNSTADGVYTRIVEVEAFSCTAVPVPTPTPTPAPCNTNVAAGAYGASASASSEAGPGYAASGAIDGNHTGAGWGSGVGWNDGTAGVFPDNLVINLGVTQALSEIDVYSLQDNYNSPIEPTDTTTFTAYGLTNFQVQIPDGVGGWLNVPGGNIVGNNLVKRKVIFASPVNTSQIRILVTASADGVYSRVVEVEAFSCTAVPGPTPTPTPAPCTTNVAASSYGTSATASSEFSAGYPAAGAIDGNHVGNPWGGGAGWNDGTAFVFPDTLTIDLVATQQLSEIDVYSLQDDYNNPVEPTDSMTFTYYGLVDFQVQIPNGLGGWVDVPGGHAVLNNLVKRKFVFGSPVTTNMIRIVVNNSSDAQYSRVVEVEAFSCDPVPTRCVNNGGTNGCSSTIQGAINAAPPNVPITVYPGTYDEDVNVNKPGIRLLGSGAGSTNIRGTMADATTSTVAITASNVTVAGFTITRLGNNTTDWNNNLNVAGISIQGQAVTNALVRDNIFTGNRNGIDVNDSSGHTFRNNVIDFNRTGFIFRNRTDNETVVENFITNNWTVGVLFLDASGGTNSPVQSALHSTFSNNNISANWYGQIADRQSGGSLPAPGTTNLKNFRGNWFGTTSPVITTANTTEPGYAAQIPTAYGGSATAPGGQPDVAGPASANLKIDPILLSGTDTNVETTAGRGTFGFQGAPNTLVSPANQRNWAFFDDFGSGTGSGGFEAGPGTPPLGTGSAFLTVDGTARYAFEVFTHYAGTRMDDITTLQYRSYQDNNANTVLAISLQFDIDYDLTDANNNFQGRLVFEPYMSGTVQQNTWQTWDARAGNWYASNTGAGGSNGLCPQNAPCTWAQVLTSFPNAGIRNTPAGGVLFKAGGPWSPGFDGNVDAFKIGINSFRTTYDFEPAP
jgi:parallel beta-helix repeat protein